MKKLLSIAIISALMAGGSGLYAQKGSNNVIHKSYSKSITPEMLTNEKFENLNAAYQFSDAQAEKIKPILNKYNTIRINAKANNEQRTITQIDKQEMNEIMKLFTAEQIAKHNAMKAADEIRKAAIDAERAK